MLSAQLEQESQQSYSYTNLHPNKKKKVKSNCDGIFFYNQLYAKTKFLILIDLMYENN